MRTRPHPMSGTTPPLFSREIAVPASPGRPPAVCGPSDPRILPRSACAPAPSERTLVGMQPSPAEKRHIAQLLTEATLAVEEAEAALESARAHRARVARVAMDSRYFTFKAVAEALGMTPVGLRKSLSSHPGAKE